MTGIIQKSLHGIKAFVGPNNILFGRNAIATGGREKPMVVLPGSADTVAIWDDFIGDTGISTRTNTGNWRVLDGDTGTDTGSNVFVTPGVGGVLRIQVGDTPKDRAIMGITGGLMWKGNQGSGPTDNKNPLRFGCRLKIGDFGGDTGTHEIHDTGGHNVNVWVGFTDTIAGEVPVIDTGGAVISNANNAVGVAFSSSRVTRGAGDTGWVAYAVNGTATLTPLVLNASPVANVYDTIEIELHHGYSDTGGTATFYINGSSAGSIAAPLAMNVALAPQILMWGDTGGGTTVEVDWINVSAPRDTGL